MMSTHLQAMRRAYEEAEAALDDVYSQYERVKADPSLSAYPLKKWDEIYLICSARVVSAYDAYIMAVKKAA